MPTTKVLGNSLEVTYNNAPTQYQADATSSSVAVVFTGQKWLRSLMVTNNGASTVYLQFFDATSAPADTTAIERPCVALAANATWEMEKPMPFVTGCVLVSSSTDSTKTASGDLDYLAIW